MPMLFSNSIIMIRVIGIWQEKGVKMMDLVAFSPFLVLKDIAILHFYFTPLLPPSISICRQNRLAGGDRRGRFYVRGLSLKELLMDSRIPNSPFFYWRSFLSHQVLLLLGLAASIPYKMERGDHLFWTLLNCCAPSLHHISPPYSHKIMMFFIGILIILIKLFAIHNLEARPIFEDFDPSKFIFRRNVSPHPTSGIISTFIVLIVHHKGTLL